MTRVVRTTTYFVCNGCGQEAAEESRDYEEWTRLDRKLGPQDYCEECTRIMMICILTPELRDVVSKHIRKNR